MKRFFFLITLILLASCDRTPESLEDWRKAEGGVEKISDWAGSEKESDAVRDRAIEILIEDEHFDTIVPIFKKITNKATQERLANVGMKIVETKWAKKDWPKIGNGTKSETGIVKVTHSDSVAAKDFAYYLHPFANATDQKKIEKILGEWTSQDRDIRTQLGKITIGQATSRAGEEGMKNMLNWIANTKKVATIARKIRKGASDELKLKLDEGIRKRAEAVHPDLQANEIKVAVLETETSAILPYLNKAIRSPKTPGPLVDGLMDALVRIQGPKSTSLFSELVSKRKGLIRWVSATRLIEVRGKSGILLAAKALPVDINAYELKEGTLEKESGIFCNFVDTEMKERKVKDISDILKRGLESNRWPVKMLALRCIEISKQNQLKTNASALINDKTPLEGFKDVKTIGQLAKKVVNTL